MSSDLIYREDAKDYARHAMAKGLNVLEYLDEVPAADFRHVVRATNISNNGFLCSACSFGDFGGFHGYKPNFCPNCGADMRQEKEEDGR